MKYLVFTALFFLIIHQDLYCQSCDRLSLKVEKLYSKGEYVKAIKIAKANLICTEDNFGVQSSQYATSLNDLAVIYAAMNELVTAKPLYIKALDIRTNVLGQNHPDVAALLRNLGGLYAGLDSFSKAEEIYLQSAEITKNNFGEENLDYALVLNELAGVYFKMGLYSKAQPLFEKSLGICKNISGEASQTYISIASVLANFYRQIGLFSQAEDLYLKIIEIRKKYFTVNDLDYFLLLDGIASLYTETGRFNQAENIALESIDGVKSLLGDRHPYFAHAQITLGYLYQKKGDYLKAEPLFHSAVEVRKKIFGKNNLQYASALNLLALNYANLSNYIKAESIWIEVLSIRQGILGEVHPDYALVVNNIAQLFVELGAFQNAEKYFIKALEINKSLYGQANINCVPALSNLAGLYRQLSDYSKAESLLLQVIEINRENLGDSSLDYLVSVNNLGLLYSSSEQYHCADSLFQVALSNSRKYFGTNVDVYSGTLHNLAILYTKMGYFDKSDSLFAELLKLKQGRQTEGSLDYSNTILFAAINNELNCKISKASVQYTSSLKALISSFRNNIGLLGSSETSVFIDSRRSNYDASLSFIYRNPSEYISDEYLNLNLLIKNILITKKELLDSLASKNADVSIKALWDEYKLISSLKKMENIAMNFDQDSIKMVDDKLAIIEKELFSKIPEFELALNNSRHSFSYLQKKLKANEAILDFVSFKYVDKDVTDTLVYGCFLVRPDYKGPKFIPLFTDNALKNILADNSILTINWLYKQKDSISKANSLLYDLIWKPLDTLLVGVNRLFISPSGNINFISIPAIPLPNGGCINDHFDIQTQMRISLDSLPTSIYPKSIYLFGGIDFDSFKDRRKSKTQIQFEAISAERTEYFEKWSYLKGTSDEVAKIHNIAVDAGLSPVIFDKDLATESNFKSLEFYSYFATNIIHIATHGFSFPFPKRDNLNGSYFSSCKSTRCLLKNSLDPLNRSGLIMSGGNIAWTADSLISSDQDEILTAREISSLDLRGCILANLSSCESGLGEIKGSEGVFGLQRAFKLAGVRYLIVTLWKVPDRETQEFMNFFYSLWLKEKLPIQAAFRKTQKEMSKKYSPFKWAAFVLLE